MTTKQAPVKRHHQPLPDFVGWPVTPEDKHARIKAEDALLKEVVRLRASNDRALHLLQRFYWWYMDHMTHIRGSEYRSELRSLAEQAKDWAVEVDSGER